METAESREAAAANEASDDSFCERTITVSGCRRFAAHASGYDLDLWAYPRSETLPPLGG